MGGIGEWPIIWDLIGWLIVLGAVVYVVFALIVVRQVQLMTNTLAGGATWMIRLISWLHLLGAVGLVVLSLRL